MSLPGEPAECKVARSSQLADKDYNWELLAEGEVVERREGVHGIVVVVVAAAAAFAIGSEDRIHNWRTKDFVQVEDEVGLAIAEEHMIQLEAVVAAAVQQPNKQNSLAVQAEAEEAQVVEEEEGYMLTEQRKDSYS